MPNSLIRLITTFFYIGHVPIIPGTMASLIGTLIYIILYDHPFVYLFLLVILIMLGFMISGQMEQILKKRDPSCVVIDEVAGVMIALYLLPLNLSVIILAFILFRVFDVLKIYPVNIFETFGGSTGIMMDDLFAGLYTNLLMHIAIRWAGVI